MKRKFDYERFEDGGFGCCVFDAEKYTEADAKAITHEEQDWPIESLKTRRAWAFYGYDEYDGEHKLCYWLSEYKNKNSFEVIVCEPV